ncbi:hypothetical protein PAXRUDRAFT_10454 [Paxillus rubicundulus Ve08.2h10]|uniref:Rrn9 domain-containing protein n=1 Tax=Paxillus rubicundulus Ve08.2h10 TaxID=930991 RepID=A0A0D0E0N1_9AGAM|nr:hypothetical protein PAXRUDRAFT_10454 [Paxillus rubicundulus Ve08.2h10]
MATRRVVVPAALHAELTEYTNLIRVIRTSRTLDLTTHLLEHAAQQRQQVDVGKGNRTSKERDTWTPWPLIDFPVPEWSFEDEIRQLGEMVARQIEGGEVGAKPGEGADDGEDDDDDEDVDPLSPPATKLLVEHAGSVLVHILNVLVDQRPSTSGSMQNRLWAMDWEDVISLLAVSGVVDRRVITRAEKRLQRIYGPSNTRAAKRMCLVESARAKFLEAAASADDTLLEPPVQRPRIRLEQHGTKASGDDTLLEFPAQRHRTRREQHGTKRHGKRRVTSKTIIETDSDR